MTDYLEQLATRNLEATPLAIRPRPLSRFEAQSTADSTTSLDETEFDLAQSPPSQIDQQDKAVQPAPIPQAIRERPVEPNASPQIAAKANDDRQQHGMVRVTEVVDHVPIEKSIPADNATESLAQRLDQLDHRLSAISQPDAPDRSLDQSVLPTEIHEAPTSNLFQETHHHLHNAEHHHQTIEQTSHSTTVVQQPENQSSASPPIPLVDESAKKPPGTVSTATSADSVPQSIHRQIEVKQIPVPEVVADDHVAAPQETPLTRQDPSPPVPTIAVEKEPAKPEQHTVTVTIGRIEVRPPSKPVPPVERAKRPAPRIMSLDDYMRRRKGGVG